MRLVTRYMMVGIQTVYKQRRCTRFLFVVYKDGGASKSTRAATNKVLTEAQEGAICEYIDCLDKINICARTKMIVGTANYLIRFENRVVGHQW